MKQVFLILLFAILSTYAVDGQTNHLVSSTYSVLNNDLYVGFCGDSESPFGFQLGNKRWNAILIVGGKESSGYTPVAYGNNSTERRDVRTVLGFSRGLKFKSNCYFDIGLGLVYNNQVVSVSNPNYGSYNYDPGDYESTIKLGAISGFSFYTAKAKWSIGLGLYSTGVTISYGLGFRL
jgi:hypothetical protein